MFKCVECGHVFDEPKTWRENEEYGFYETFSACPWCGENYEEAERCKICGEWFVPDELTGGMCDDCIYEHKAYKDCKHVFEGETTEIKVDYLAAMLLDESTINAILRDYLDKRLSDTDCTEAIDDDKAWFAEKLVKIMKGDK